MVRTDTMHQFAPTMRAELHTQPSIFDSGPAPLGYEAAPPPAQPCRGWCARQGRHSCGRQGCAPVKTETQRYAAELTETFRDSQAAALAVGEIQARRQWLPDRLAAATCLVAACVWIGWEAAPAAWRFVAQMWGGL